jgi:hypothetical protein
VQGVFSIHSPRVDVSGKKPVLLPVAVLLVGAALRFLSLADLPPGLFFDESANGVDALRVLGGWHPIFFPADQGREPLFIYLQAAAMALIGPSPFALRLPAAFLGVLTIAATYAAFRAIAGPAIGLIGSALLAASFWHVGLSRLAFRTDAMPLFTTLAAFFLWKGVRGGRLAPFLIGGIYLGIGLYTYIPARLAPALFAAWLAGCILIPGWRCPSSARRVALGMVLALGACAVVALPLAYYFYHHPHDFIERIHNAVGPAPSRTTLEGFERAISGMFWIGDPNVRHDLPGRPLVELPVAVLGIVGLIWGRRWRDGSGALVAIWCIAMLAPAALTDEPAHALRLAGELPFVLFFPAVGLGWIASRRSFLRAEQAAGDSKIENDPHPRPLPKGEGIGHLPRRGCEALRLSLLGESARRAGEGSRTVLRLRGMPLGPAFALMFICGMSLVTARDYFVLWPELPEVNRAFQADLLHALDLVDQVPAGLPIVATSLVVDGMPIPSAFVPRVGERVHAVDGEVNFVLPIHGDQPIYYVYARSDEPPDFLQRLDGLTRIATSLDRFGQIDGELFRADSSLRLPPPSRDVAANIGSSVRVEGADLTSRVQPGDYVPYALHWTVRGRGPSAKWELFAHLVDRTSQRLIAQDYNRGFAPSEWRDGDQVISWLHLQIPAGTPAEVAEVHFGVLDPESGQLLPVTTPGGKPAGDVVVAGPVRIVGPVTTPPPPARVVRVRYGPAMILTGLDVELPDASHTRVRLHWQADASMQEDYTVFVHLLDSSGRFLVGADSQPAGGQAPTSTWQAGETFVDDHVLTIVPGSQVTALEIGVYLLATGERLRATDMATGQSLGNALLLPR